MLAVLADAAAIVVAVDVQGETLAIHLLVVDALVAVAMAIAGCEKKRCNEMIFDWESSHTLLTLAVEWTRVGVLAPLLLLESRTALVALNAAGVVLAATGQYAHRTQRILDIAGIGMAIAHAASSDRDVLDRVEVTPCHRRILSCHRHQVAQQILGTQQTYAHIGGTCPLLQHGRVKVVGGRGTSVEQHYGYFAILQRHNFRIFRGANDIVVARDWLVGVLAKVCLTIGGRVGEVLPRRPGLAIIR